MSLVSKILGFAMLSTIPMLGKGMYDAATKRPTNINPTKIEKTVVIGAFIAMGYGSLAYSGWKYREQLSKEIMECYNQNLSRLSRREVA